MKPYFSRLFPFRKRSKASGCGSFDLHTAVSLLIGVIAALAAVYETPGNTIKGFGDAIIGSEKNASVLSAYWNCSRYHIFTILFSTSWLGTALVPALLAYRGFNLCCSSVALLIDYPDVGTVLTAIILGLPGLISVPCLILIASYSMEASAGVMSLRFGHRQRYPAHSDLRRIVLCFICLIPVAVYEALILPKLITMVIS